MVLATLTAALLVASAPAQKPKLAAPGLDGLNLEPKALQIFSDHLATQFTFEAVEVTTPAQIEAVVGLERQKQLLGCQDNSSCMMEIGDALGVDGILTGSISRFDDLYQLNLKVVSARDATALATYSSRVEGGQKRLVQELDRAAKVMARLMKQKLAAANAAATPAVTKVEEPPKTAPASATTSATTTTPSPTGAGVAASSTAPSAADVPARRKNRITLGLSTLNVVTLPIEYERSLGDSFAFAVGANLGYSLLGGYAGFSALNLSGSLALRWYVQGRAPEGFWVGPEAWGGIQSYVTQQRSGAQFFGDVLATAGYTIVANSGFTASFGAGVGARFFDGTYQGSGVNPQLSLHVNLGYAF